MEQETYDLSVQPRYDLEVARSPEIVLEEARKAAKALGDVLKNKKKPVVFNNEQYLEFEDWQTVGRFYGITAKIISTAPVDFGEVRGFEAHAVALNTRTGLEISAADAMCLNDEPNWSKKPLFQLRSMAQTRAAAKALRNVLAWVVVLAGYKPTPAEEMDGVFHQPKVQQPPEPPNSAKDTKKATTDGSLEGAIRTALKELADLTGAFEPDILELCSKFEDAKKVTHHIRTVEELMAKSEKWANSTLGRIKAKIDEVKKQDKSANAKDIK